MNSLLTLRDSDIFPHREVSKVLHWKDRRTGKMIILDKAGRLALVGNRVHEFFLLPGGGIDDHEDVIEGILRECLEETGCRIIITHELGITDDYRARDSQHSINYGFIGKVVSYENQQLTESEIDIGLYTKWTPFSEALEIFSAQEDLLKAQKVDFYNTGFNIVRDKFFLEKAYGLLTGS